MASWVKNGPGSPDQPRATLFLDRDGVVIRDCDYLAIPDLVELLPGAAEGLRQARAAGFQLIGVSNQSGLGRGYFGEPEFEAVMTRLDERLAEYDLAWDGFYYCPHAPGAGCNCRKPRPGLLQEAAASFAWDPIRSWLIGDKESDIALGLQAGLGAVLVRTGYGAEQETRVRSRWPDESRLLYADDLPTAVGLITSRFTPGQPGGAL